MPWNRVVLVTTVLLTLTTVPVVGVPQCKEGPVYRDGIEMYTGSGVLDGSSVKNKDCESGECGMSLYLLDEHTEKKIYAAFFCVRSKKNLTRNWIKSPNERVALFYCTDDTNPDSRPCNDPAVIFNVDGEEQKKNEDELRQIGIIINDRATVDISTTPVAVEGTPSEAPDAEGDSDVVTEKEADTPVPESVEIAATDEPFSDAPEATVGSVSAIRTENEKDTPAPEPSETYDDYEEQAPPTAHESPAPSAVEETSSEAPGATVDSGTEADIDEREEMPPSQSIDTEKESPAKEDEIPEIPAAPAPTDQQDVVENKPVDEAAAPAATNKEAIAVTSSESPVLDPTQPIETTLDVESSSVTDTAPPASDSTDQEPSERNPAAESTSSDHAAEPAVTGTSPALGLAAPAPDNAADPDSAASPSVPAAATGVSATRAPNTAAANGLTLAGVTILAVIRLF